MKASFDDGDFQTIKLNNPNVSVILGKESINRRANLKQQLLAKARIAEFVLCARFRYEDGIFPLLPNVPEQVSDSLRLLEKEDDKDYLADIATLLMRYTIEIRRYYRPGPVWGHGDYMLLDAFLDGMKLEAGLEGIPALSVGNWICNHRDRLAASVVLDMQIERNEELLSELTRTKVYLTH